MLCLLDKVTARFMLRALLKIGNAEPLHPEEQECRELFSLGMTDVVTLCISPATNHILQQFATDPRYTKLIHSFLREIPTFLPERYFKRWSRRLREYGFTREDAAILALASFASHGGHFTSANYVVTFDQRMMNNWNNQAAAIRARFDAMHIDLLPPYRDARLPFVVLPDQIPLAQVPP